MKQTVKYSNRYGDDYTFTAQENGTILWEGPFDYYRVLYDPETEQITAIDPSGGPFISTGFPFRYLNSNNRISRLEWIDNGAAVKITLES
jgi:hypothetical protein